MPQQDATQAVTSDRLTIYSGADWFIFQKRYRKGRKTDFRFLSYFTNVSSHHMLQQSTQKATAMKGPFDWCVEVGYWSPVSMETKPNIWQDPTTDQNIKVL